MLERILVGIIHTSLLRKAMQFGADVDTLCCGDHRKLQDKDEKRQVPPNKNIVAKKVPPNKTFSILTKHFGQKETKTAVRL
jgi:hypothetical protein